MLISVSNKFTDSYTWRKKEMKCEKGKDAGSKITLGARRVSVLYMAKGQKYK